LDHPPSSRLLIAFFDLPNAGVDDQSIRAVINYPGPVNTPDEPDNIEGGCSLPRMYKIKSVRKPVYYQYRVGYDLATVTLDTDAGCPGIDTVRMAGLSYDLAGWVNRHWTLLGFGATDGERGEPSAYLKRLQSPIKSVGTSDQYCNLNAPSDKRVASQVCVFEMSDEEAAASGDSGGPWSLWNTTLSERILAAVQSSGQVNDKGKSFGSLHSPAWFQDWILSTIIESDKCLPTIVNESLFFVGYVSNASQQYCELGKCGHCSDSVATDPSTIRRNEGPNVNGCMAMSGVDSTIYTTTIDEPISRSCNTSTVNFISIAVIVVSHWILSITLAGIHAVAF